MDDKAREEQEKRVMQLRNKYVVKARRGMSGPDMHKELRSDIMGEPALTDLQIAAIVAYAFHPFHNPHMEFKKGWDINDPVKAKVPL